MADGCINVAKSNGSLDEDEHMRDEIMSKMKTST